MRDRSDSENRENRQRQNRQEQGDAAGQLDAGYVDCGEDRVGDRPQQHLGRVHREKPRDHQL